MKLRWLFYGSIILGIGLMIGYPWIIGRPPQGLPAKHPDVKAFSWRTLGYLATLLATFIACFVSAVLLVRRTREEAAAEARENLRKLTDGTAEDLRRARESDREEP